MRAHPRSIGLRTAAVAAMLLAAALAGPAAAGGVAAPRTEPCIAPNGTDVNAHFGVEAAIVNPVCTRIRSGARWTTTVGWYGAKSWQQIPPGYVTGGPTPFADFVARFVGVRIVIDAGTPHEFTVEWKNSPALWVGTTDTLDLANAVTLGTVHALAVGTHTVQPSIVMSAESCDGLSAVTAESCIPAGETSLQTVTFSVVP